MLHAVEEGELAIVQRMLLLCGPQVALIPGQISGLSRSSAHFAASGGHPEVLQVLLAAAPELLQEVDENGWTCLHAAVNARRVQVVESLFGLGDARLLAMQCRIGRTPLQMSMAMGESAITTLLHAAA